MHPQGVEAQRGTLESVTTDIRKEKHLHDYWGSKIDRQFFFRAYNSCILG
jgi:hypothetical protein